ncbi:SGNH/GDSL hydrolase family protein [Cognatishimia sp. SS12]|uniref:SGNH/GDSL hydrolase family protein n=1 Tax=Cognatishimia sp. SS12 TaxID=2979465 RepID=UPI00232EAEFC|nr:SGNH/GDSL hydrolase family protein [Cognatishimia sp. SS12]MDC0739280.1 SGNH/GDSL hydrolase family protein [Cognatishimia sp. SS12]
MKLISLPIFLSTFVLASCVQETASRNDPRILAMGDSMMAAHRISGRAVSDVVARNLREPVHDNSVVGASMSYALPISGAMGLNISKQYRGGQWDWVVLNGGGNDLWLGCGCNQCDHKMESLISSNGVSGKIPSLIARLRGTGAQVLWVGYLRSPGVGSPIENCSDEGDELEARLARFAAGRHGVHFVSIADLVPYGDRSFHGIDMIHPSLKASAAIGARVSNYIRQHDPAR